MLGISERRDSLPGSAVTIKRTKLCLDVAEAKARVNTSLSLFEKVSLCFSQLTQEPSFSFCCSIF